MSRDITPLKYIYVLNVAFGMSSFSYFILWLSGNRMRLTTAKCLVFNSVCYVQLYYIWIVLQHYSKHWRKYASPVVNYLIYLLSVHSPSYVVHCPLHSLFIGLVCGNSCIRPICLKIYLWISFSIIYFSIIFALLF